MLSGMVRRCIHCSRTIANTTPVVITNRLVTSPCAVVADSFGYTANIQRLMSAQASHAKDKDPMLELAMKAKTLEINPRSPLIEGLLRRVEALGDEPDPEEEEEWPVLPEGWPLPWLPLPCPPPPLGSGSGARDCSRRFSEAPRFSEGVVLRFLWERIGM